LRESTGLTNDWRNLLAVFSAALRMLHPLVPFITEELWHRLGHEDSISLQPYPAEFPVDEDAEREMASLNAGHLSAAHTPESSNGCAAIHQEGLAPNK
jgi:valyl-tRNA synthetase